jgi:nitrate/nitrite transport system substrate-binding protein
LNLSLPKRGLSDSRQGTNHPSEPPAKKALPVGTGSELTRRRFLSMSTKGFGLTALLGELPTGWAGSVFASDAPEVPEIKLGIIALTDCSPFVIAHEKGFFQRYGIKATINKGANWAAIRDALSNGDNQATHMLLGMPIASTMGLAGSPRKPMIVPWLVNRNGQAITLANKFKGKVSDDPKALKPFVEEAKAAGSPLAFAMTFPPGTHAMWMRYFLGAGGVHPDTDVSLITVPPPQMVANMKVGKMDGFCVGEPWNARAIADDIGFTGITSQGIWKDHPEKVCAFTAEFADANPKAVKAVLKGLNDASVWADDLANRAELASIVSAPSYINCEPDVILGRLEGKYLFGDGRKLRDPNYMIFSERNCNYPQSKYAKWWLTQFRRWGLVEGAPDYAGISRQVMRPDLYEEAMKEAGHPHGGQNNDSETLFDGMIFDPNGDLEAYASGFAVKNLKG